MTDIGPGKHDRTTHKHRSLHIVFIITIINNHVSSVNRSKTVWCANGVAHHRGGFCLDCAFLNKSSDVENKNKKGKDFE